MYSHLILSGGGVKGVTMLGALIYLEKNNIIDSITNIGGTSIGALIGSLLCIMKPSEIQCKINGMFGFKESDINIKNLFINYGVIGDNHLVNFVGNLFIEKLNTIPTMLELYNISKKELDIYTVNINRQQLEKLNYKNTPDLLISNAVHMSINLPFLFTKVKYNNSYYVDGGIIENFPWKYYEHISIEKKIGIDLTSKNIDLEISTLSEYIFQILYSMWSQKNCTYTEGVLCLKEDCSVFQFNMSSEKTNDQLKSGFTQMSEYLKKRI